MFTRYLHATVLAAALLAVAPLSNAAEAKPAQTMEHQHDVTILHLVETAQTSADHEAIAKRLDEEATQLEKQAGQHERLAKQYHRGQGVPPKGNAASLASHCDALTKNLKASATDARAMAQLHREVAHELAK